MENKFKNLSVSGKASLLSGHKWMLDIFMNENQIYKCSER